MEGSPNITKKSFWHFVLESMQERSEVKFLLVVESSGSSPGRRGFKMAVGDDEIFGSIGGGVMETKLVNRARAGALRSGLIEQVHRAGDENASGMICSGKQRIAIVNLDGEDLLEIERIVRAIESDEECLIEIRNGKIRSEKLEKTQPKVLYAPFQIDSDGWIYSEIIGRRPKLLIFGGGHCSLALSKIAADLDFEIVVIDDRPGLNTFENNSYATRKITVDSYDTIGEMIDGGEDTYAVVMTLGFASDEIVIRELIGKKLKYVGVLGSRAKMRVLLKKLETEGFSNEELKKLRTPIGVDIGSKTPAEIAVSIAAELIKVKNSV